jgi:DNA polymerase III subunit epsilon
MLSTDLLKFYRQISQQPLTVVDVETTGSRPPKSRVMEVSVLQASLQRGIKHQKTQLINPALPIPALITRVTGIDQAMVETAPVAAAVWADYLPLLNTGVLTAHNLAFDYSFLRAEFASLDIEFFRPPEQRLCTVILARLMLPELPSRSLPDLVKHFAFPVARSHRAEDDTMACWLLAQRLLKELQTEDDAVLLARFAQQWLPVKEVAKILHCSAKAARVQLTKAGVEPRLSPHRKTLMYQRGAVESVFWQHQGQQLSLF